MAEIYTGIRNIEKGELLEGVSPFPASFEPKGQMPFDARSVVYKYTDLIKGCSTLFPNKNVYNGMTVTTLIGKSGKPEIWVLKDFETYTGSTTESEIIACWEQVSADSAAIGNDIDTKINALKVVKLDAAATKALGDNVLEAYELHNGDTTMGAPILIYKDKTLKSVTLDDATQELVFTYIVADGSESVVRLNISAIAFDKEIEDALGKLKGRNGIEVLPKDADGIRYVQPKPAALSAMTTQRFVVWDGTEIKETSVVDFGTW